MIAQPRGPVWVRDEDLVQTVYELRVVNSGSKSKAQSPHEAEIIELGSDGLALRLPRSLCSEGHLLSIELTFRRKPDNEVISKLIMTGKVLSITPLDEASNLSSIRLYQFEEPAWGAFREKHLKRQIRVSEAIVKRQS